MALSLPVSLAQSRLSRRYLRAPVPLHFPEEERMPEGEHHFLRRILLYQVARHSLPPDVLISSDQFVYWDPTDPRKCLSPDLGLRVGARRDPISTWKTWERGAPHVGVELVSPSDSAARDLDEKLERYRQAGIAEVVRLDPENATQPLRFWDLVEGDMVERDPADPEARRCDALGLYWCACPDEELVVTLRLARDPLGKDLLLTREEAERAEKEAERAQKEAAVAAKDEALARIAELEAELARRR